MNPPKYSAIDYINFLIGTQKADSCSEAEIDYDTSVICKTVLTLSFASD